MKNINLISWLRNWFYTKDEHIEYSLGASENSPNLNDTITISVMVKKGDYLAQGHHFELVINDNTVIPLSAEVEKEISIINRLIGINSLYRGRYCIKVQIPA